MEVVGLEKVLYLFIFNKNLHFFFVRKFLHLCQYYGGRLSRVLRLKILMNHLVKHIVILFLFLFFDT